jgi:hypothetical protein
MVSSSMQEHLYTLPKALKAIKGWIKPVQLNCRHYLHADDWLILFPVIIQVSALRASINWHMPLKQENTELEGQSKESTKINSQLSKLPIPN